MIKGIFLDWYGVIQTFSFKLYFEELNKLILIEKMNLHKNEFTVKNYKKISSEIDLSKLNKEAKKIILSDKELKKQFRKSYDQQKIGKITIKKHYELLCKHLDIPYRPELLRFYVFLLPNASKKFNEPLIHLIKKLHYENKDLKFAILSNGSKELCYNQKRIITNFGLNFIKFYSSAELGISKPDKKFFNTALKYYDLNPEEVIYVDDQPKNITPTRKMGFNVIQYEFPKSKGIKLVNDIQKILELSKKNNKHIFINEEGIFMNNENDLF